MQTISKRTKRTQAGNPNVSRKKRLGAIVLLASGLMIMVFGFLAFTVDVGYIALTKAQLESANDAGVRAAVYELRDALGYGATKTDTEAKTAAVQAAVSVAGSNRAGDQQSIYVNPTRDVRVGNLTFDATTGTWVKQWGVAPYNMAELTLHRDQLPTGNTTTGDGAPVNPNGDAPLPLFFAPVIGHDDAPLRTRSISAMLPGNGFRVPVGSGKRAGVLPFALDEDTWLKLI
ncbi:MAG: Tad domain-containing protein, partial [Planctomycetaceae bacterium]|nr:Tad domain-containing protein [Planctomycetaceae bacterium]